MKHSYMVTLSLILLFFASQIIGLAVVSAYIDVAKTQESGNAAFSALPYNMERPDVDQSTSYIWMIGIIIVGTMIVLLLYKFHKPHWWRYWFFGAVVLTLSVSFSAFINSIFAFFFSFGLAYWKIFKPNVFVHNLTEVFIYGGLAAIFVPILNVTSAVLLLIFISIYDAFAVWQSKHMVTLANFQTSAKVFAGIFLPYSGKVSMKDLKKTTKKGKRVIKTAVLGGGDIGFPLIFTGVVMKSLIVSTSAPVAFLKAIIISVTTTISLFLLLYYAKKDRYYPAMPFLSTGCFLGMGIVFLL